MRKDRKTYGGWTPNTGNALHSAPQGPKTVGQLAEDEIKAAQESGKVLVPNEFHPDVRNGISEEINPLDNIALVAARYREAEGAKPPEALDQRSLAEIIATFSQPTVTDELPTSEVVSPPGITNLGPLTPSAYDHQPYRGKSHIQELAEQLGTGGIARYSRQSEDSGE